MIHSIRKLAREIHRRSVWQVLAAFMLLAVFVLEAVTLLATRVGLPLWTPTMAVVLLAIGLPIVLATCVVQGGLPGLRIEDAGDPNELPGRTPAEVLVVPGRHRSDGLVLLTWRNTILGGVMAAALLVTSVAAYLAMWAAGFGPVGSLMSQGALAEHDIILVAIFDNHTDDPTIPGSIRDLLMTGLGRSEAINVIGNSAARQEVVAFVEGDVSRVRRGFRVDARIVNTAGVTLARFQETASHRDEIPPRMELLSLRVRHRIGESLKVIHADRAAVAALYPR